MITRVRPAAEVTVHFGSHKPISKITAHQNMIETKASVAPEGVAEIIEECVDPLVRMKSADCICPSLCDEPLECLADKRLSRLGDPAGIKLEPIYLEPEMTTMAVGKGCVRRREMRAGKLRLPRRR